jgi:rSAM/selenodomain-associated transferase 1
MKKALITFVKTPLPGTVKTRLQKDLGRDETVRVYKSFIREITSQYAGMKGFDRFLGCAPTKNHDFLQEIAAKNKMKTFNQRGSDLGKKIVNAFKDYFKKGYSDIILIGSDSPTIPKEFIRKAFRDLEKNDFVVGPCCDGGMYLVGARKKIESRLFQNIPWDTSDVLNMVLEKLYRYRIEFSMLPFWYDVDNIDDLKFLKLHLRYLKKELPK